MDTKNLYDTLPLSAGQFRLVTLHPIFASASNADALPSGEPTLRCDLYIASREHSPPYEPLSYTWGDAKDTVPLLVNGIEIPVTRNLRVALEHIRDDHIDTILWIDALCINQKDDKEKSEQVKHMRDIYGNGSSTRAWLGLGDKESDEAIAELDRIGHLIISEGTLDLMIEFALLPSGNPERYQSLQTMINGRLSGFFETALLDLTRTAYLLNAVANLSSREYWYRVWIMQEIVVSPNMRIQCGRSTVFSPQFYAGYFYFMMMQPHIITKVHSQYMESVASPRPGGNGDAEEIFRHFQAIATPTLSPPTMKIFGTRRRYQLPPSSSTSNTKNTLIELLVKLHVTSSNKPSSRATDDRDRIFALLGMASDQDQLGIVPDYSLSCSAVYTLAARAMIMAGQVDLLSLSQVEESNDGKGDDANIPSWVPDWRAEWILRPSGQLPWDTAFKASGDSVIQFDTRVESTPLDQLTLNGYLVGSVETLGKKWEPHLINGCVTDPPGMAAYLLDIGNLCHLSDQKFIQTGHNIYVNNDDRRLAHIRVPVADQEEYGIGFIRRATLESSQGYKDVMEDIKFRIDLMLCRNLDLGPPVQLPGDPPEMTDVKRRYFQMMGWQRNRRSFLAQNGYVGLAPLHVAEDDVIVIFEGGKFPYILRKKDTGTFRFIGEAYVHGIMYGEFMKSEVKPVAFTME